MNISDAITVPYASSISGIFFEGNESRILNLPEVDLITCDDCVDELYRITRNKIKHLGNCSLEFALLELEKALSDIEVLQRVPGRFSQKRKAAIGLYREFGEAPRNE